MILYPPSYPDHPNTHPQYGPSEASLTDLAISSNDLTISEKETVSSVSNGRGESTPQAMPDAVHPNSRSPPPLHQLVAEMQQHVLTTTRALDALRSEQTVSRLMIEHILANVIDAPKAQSHFRPQVRVPGGRTTYSIHDARCPGTDCYPSESEYRVYPSTRLMPFIVGPLPKNTPMVRQTTPSHVRLGSHYRDARRLRTVNNHTHSDHDPNHSLPPDIHPQITVPTSTTRSKKPIRKVRFAGSTSEPRPLESSTSTDVAPNEPIDIRPRGPRARTGRPIIQIQRTIHNDTAQSTTITRQPRRSPAVSSHSTRKPMPRVKRGY